MNTIGKAGLALSVSILLCLGSCQKTPKTDGSRPEEVKPPGGIISLEESKSLYDNYSRNRVEPIQAFELEQNPDAPFVPARFTAFGFEEIKQYISFIEQEAKAANVDISSLRFYFANYPKDPNFPDGRKVVHPRQNSIFIVPTMKVDGSDWGFYIGADGKAKRIKDAKGDKALGKEQGMTSRAGIFASSASWEDPQSLNLNHGDSGPPPFTDFD